MAKKNHRSADAVADYFLLRTGMEGDYIGNLKMQKLCYFAQGWSLALRGKALFDDVFEAWALGPALPPLFQRFQRYRWHPLDAYKRRTDCDKELDAEEQKFLDWIWDVYSRHSANELKRLTRAQTPWKEAHGDTEGIDPCREEITQASMKAYFLKQKPPAGRNVKRPKAA